jgi:hypothetical protein
MSKRFAHCESELMHIQLTPKHDGNNIGRGLRRGARGFDFGQTLRMMRGQLCNTPMQSAKRFPV